MQNHRNKPTCSVTRPSRCAHSHLWSKSKETQWLRNAPQRRPTIWSKSQRLDCTLWSATTREMCPTVTLSRWLKIFCLWVQTPTHSLSLNQVSSGSLSSHSGSNRQWWSQSSTVISRVKVRLLSRLLQTVLSRPRGMDLSRKSLLLNLRKVDHSWLKALYTCRK